MIFNVWHKDEPKFHDNDAATLAAFPKGFTHVGNVDTFHIGRVFELSNSIDRAWWDNPQVEKIVPGGLRSSSVGDVFVNEFDGKRYAVCSVGLKEF